MLHTPMRAHCKGTEQTPRAPEGQQGPSPRTVTTLAQNQRDDTFFVFLRLAVEHAAPLIQTEHFRGVKKHP